MKLSLLRMFFVVLLCVSFLFLSSKNSYKKAQQLHQKISDDLIALRKEYPKSQSTIYPILDEIGQMYKISRNMIKKKKIMKQKIVLQSKDISKLVKENNELKQKITNTQQLSIDKQKEFDELNKKLKTSQVHLAFLSREREELNKRINQIEEQQLQQLEKNEVNKTKTEQSEIASLSSEDQNLN